MVKSAVKEAVVSHDKDKDMPKLLAGDITPLVIKQCVKACKNHFRTALVADEVQVATIVSRMEDPRLIQWYTAQSGYLDALSFDEFITKV